MIKVVLLGAGNVATHLFEAFQQSNEIDVVQVYNQSKNRLRSFKERVSTTTNLKELKKADVYIIAIKDDAIEKLSNQLPHTDRLIVHTSGSVSINSLSKHNRHGVFYPLQTFTKGKEVNFKTIPICLETAVITDYIILEKLAKAISQAVYNINSTQRKALHVAAIFVNNFVNHLYQKSNEICEEHKVPFEVLHPLLLETAQKALEMNPLKAQTGPAIRKDQKIIESHIKNLSTQQQKDIYTILTKSIQETHGNKL
ncbi:Rossmann-like and DUF2520 domain-containing protein [Pseudofulvibacter geojedonensis]|uniref:Rossmann-like and DUF2520 domain-containing protein n=1 Tax=Pseudofulvibacter geojedonensis TaxID=1123758 RepID=A0ABW3I2P6_9FLAO